MSQETVRKFAEALKKNPQLLEKLKKVIAESKENREINLIKLAEESGFILSMEDVCLAEAQEGELSDEHLSQAVGGQQGFNISEWKFRNIPFT